MSVVLFPVSILQVIIDHLEDLNQTVEVTSGHLFNPETELTDRTCITLLHF